MTYGIDFLSQKKKREIRRSLWNRNEINNEKSLFISKRKILKKIVIRDVRNLFDLSIDKHYYKPITITNAFNSNHIEYDSIEDKEKILTIKKYLCMIRPYLINLINDHKTQDEWKIHLMIAINFNSYEILMKVWL